MKTTKYLYFTDIHNRSEKDQPKSRLDNYYRSVLAKQEEVGDLIKAHHIDYLLFGGDLFHHYDPPMGLVHDVTKIWKTYSVTNIVGVIGSHDYNGYQVQTLRRSGIGNLALHGLIDLVGDDNNTMFPRWIDTGNLIITGTPHSAMLASDPKNFTTVQGVMRNTLPVVQLVHGDLFYEPVMWEHQTIDAILPYINADLVLSGHIHTGWNPIVKKNAFGETTFINPGSIGRTSVSKPRRIQVVIFEVENTASNFVIRNIQYVPLKNIVEQPFRESSEMIEASPISDFSGLMSMISGMDLKQTDFKTYIPALVREVCGDNQNFVQDVTNRVLTVLDTAEKEEK